LVIAANELLSKSAVESAFAGRCVEIATLRAALAGQYSTLIEITADQWRFLRGVYAMNAEAPPGLPCGNDVVLEQGGGNSEGLLFFVDGHKLGAPMHAPPALLSLMEQQRRPK
jgi:hypothetical protein